MVSGAVIGAVALLLWGLAFRKLTSSIPFFGIAFFSAWFAVAGALAGLLFHRLVFGGEARATAP